VPPDGEQIFRVYLGDLDPPTLDPNAAEDSQSISLLTALHRGLMYFTPELGSEPALAESVSNNEDFTEFTFTLREGLTYSDGTTPITSEDFVYSWRRLVTPSLANPYGYLLCIVQGVDTLLASCGADADGPDEDAQNIGVSAPDERTFVVTLNSPATFFLSIASMWPTVPLEQSWVEGGPFGEAAGYIGSGPYMLTEWAHNSRMVMAPNPHWVGDPATVTVDLAIGGDPDAAFASFEQGLLDTVVVPGTQLRRVLDDPTYAENYELIQQAQQAITYYGFATCVQPADACPPSDATNDGRSPTANLNFRIALTQAINKQQFIDLTFGGTGQIANSFVMPGLLGYQGDDYAGPYPFDPAAATAAMDAALAEMEVADNDGDGAVTAADLGTLTIGYNSNAGHLPRVVNLAEQWRTNLGFTEEQFQLIGSDFATFLQQRQAGEYHVSRNGWGADFPHPHNQLSGLFTCGGTNNDEQWCDEAFDALLEEGARTTDATAQDDIYRRAEQIMLEAAVMLPLRFGNVTYLVQPWVQGLTPTASDHQNIGDSFYETITIAPH
jgi:ABC-type oligopeptide transport system substrate-binding subunit